MLKEKQKVNDYLPIAYNLYFVNSSLKSFQNNKVIQAIDQQVKEQLDPVLHAAASFVDHRNETLETFNKLESEVREVFAESKPKAICQ